jgi:hypothetical protein
LYGTFNLQKGLIFYYLNYDFHRFYTTFLIATTYRKNISKFRGTCDNRVDNYHPTVIIEQKKTQNKVRHLCCSPEIQSSPHLCYSIYVSSFLKKCFDDAFVSVLCSVVQCSPSNLRKDRGKRGEAVRGEMSTRKSLFAIRRAEKKRMNLTGLEENEGQGLQSDPPHSPG